MDALYASRFAGLILAQNPQPEFVIELGERETMEVVAEALANERCEVQIDYSNNRLKVAQYLRGTPEDNMLH